MFVLYDRDSFEQGLSDMLMRDGLNDYTCRRVTDDLSALEEVYEIDVGFGSRVRIYSTLDVGTRVVHRLGSAMVRIVLVVNRDGMDRYLKVSSHRRRANLFMKIESSFRDLVNSLEFYVGEESSLEDQLYKVI